MIPSGFGVEWSAYHTLTWLVTSLKYCLWVPFSRGKDSWGVQSVIHTISPEINADIRVYVIMLISPGSLKYEKKSKFAWPMKGLEWPAIEFFRTFEKGIQNHSSWDGSEIGSFQGSSKSVLMVNFSQEYGLIIGWVHQFISPVSPSTIKKARNSVNIVKTESKENKEAR